MSKIGQQWREDIATEIGPGKKVHFCYLLTAVYSKKKPSVYRRHVSRRCQHATFTTKSRK